MFLPITVFLAYRHSLPSFSALKTSSGKREFFDKTGALKTRYYGNEASDYQIVFYDKKQERLNKSTDENEKELFSSFDTLWRIEFRLHNNNFIKNQIKRNFSVLEKQRITTRNYDLLDTLELSAQEKIFIRARAKIKRYEGS